MLLLKLISNEIENLKKNGFYRKLPESEIFNNFNKTTLNYCVPDVKMINLSTNDYLGLSFNNKIKKAAKDAITLYSTSSSSSPLISGRIKPHEDLELQLCAFKGGYDRCILYPSGYQANIGIISAVAGISPLKTFIAFDELSHASIIDGVRISGVKFARFKHNNADHLKKILEKHTSYSIKIVITEGVFSMDGDIANLPEIIMTAKNHDALTIVDDAHATGTIGVHGGGSCDYHNIKPDILMGTLGKALASNGAFVLSNSIIINYLINKSRAFIFSTAVAPSSAAAALKALNLIKDNQKIVAGLQKKSKFARTYLKENGLNILDSTTHIIPVLVGDEKKAVAIEKELLKNGIYLKAVRHPTVPKNEARLRISINARLSMVLIKKTLTQIINIVKKYNN
jgi:8-amino-7-oxononanoate synthase